jgi:WD40 repeat protein
MVLDRRARATTTITDPLASFASASCPPKEVYAVASSKQHIASGDSNRLITLFSIANIQATEFKLEGHTGAINALDFSPDGAKLVYDALGICPRECYRIRSNACFGLQANIYTCTIQLLLHLGRSLLSSIHLLSFVL